LILAAFAVTLVLFVAFLLIEFRIAAPMLPLRLFTNATISTGMYAGLVINFALAGQLFIFSLYYQQVLGFSALLAGLAFLPMTVPMVINATLTGRIVSRIGSRIPMLLGFTLNTIGLLIHLLTNTHTSFFITAVGLVFNGVGMTMVLPALMLAMITAAPKDLLGTISGGLNSFRQLGGAIGVAVLGAILNSTSTFNTGFHLALIVAAVALASGLILVAIFVHPQPR
jgi:DHA2 family methylenomycin A resistance protein-like MFS transporter